MNAPRLSDLREPPVVGRFYMVPIVRFPWLSRRADWPVLGPMHTDVDFFNFPNRHYHVDVRFLNKNTRKWAASQLPHRLWSDDLTTAAARVATGYPLNHLYLPLPDGRPLLMRRRCAIAHVPFGFANAASVIDTPSNGFQKLRAAYADPAPAIARKDGRLLCPHRKVDLSSFAPDADGVVTCPLHGLRVQCRKVAA